uniref:Uncharacterized protein n=1 Tax=Aegilops tauschii subsp. strangulata TaxID=200361 RepID=A0A452YQQ6_AEGTS
GASNLRAYPKFQRTEGDGRVHEPRTRACVRAAARRWGDSWASPRPRRSWQLPLHAPIRAPTLFYGCSFSFFFFNLIISPLIFRRWSRTLISSNQIKPRMREHGKGAGKSRPASPSPAKPSPLRPPSSFAPETATGGEGRRRQSTHPHHTPFGCG